MNAWKEDAGVWGLGCRKARTVRQVAGRLEGRKPGKV